MRGRMGMMMVSTLAAGLGLLTAGTPPVAAGPQVVNQVGTVPDAPASVIVTEGWNAVTVRYTAPASDGGSPVTGYSVRALLDGVFAASASGGAPGTPATMPNIGVPLSNGRTYTIEVRARNRFGLGAPATTEATPFEPTSHVPLDIGVSCGASSSFTVNNSNPFPVYFDWSHLPTLSSGGRAVGPHQSIGVAGVGTALLLGTLLGLPSPVPAAVPIPIGILSLTAGQSQVFQDIGLGIC